MSPKTTAGPVISAGDTLERSWALEAWTARLSWGAMRRLANLPPAEGGLGYDLSESALKGLVAKAREDRGDVTMGRDERRERQGVEVDMRARAARRDLDAAYTRAAVIDDALEQAGDLIEDISDIDRIARLAAERRELHKIIDTADARLERAQAREAKLYGLDAATEVAIDVTHRDAVDAELNEMLARIDPKAVRRGQDAGS